MKILVTLLAALAPAILFSQSTNTGTWQTWHNAPAQIKYPSQWSTDTSGYMGTVLFALSPLEKDGDKFRENLNVMHQSLIGMDITLHDYKLITEQQIRETTTNSNMIQSAVVRGENGQQYRVEYEMTQGNLRLHVVSICIIHDKKAWLATFTAEAAKYDAFKATGEAMLQSFTVGNN